MEGGSTVTGISTGITTVVADIWTLVGTFISFANQNTVVWIPVGFAVARATVSPVPQGCKLRRQTQFVKRHFS